MNNREIIPIAVYVNENKTQAINIQSYDYYIHNNPHELDTVEINIIDTNNNANNNVDAPIHVINVNQLPQRDCNMYEYIICTLKITFPTIMMMIIIIIVFFWK